MNKTTKSIVLVFVGSAPFVAGMSGCRSSNDNSSNNASSRRSGSGGAYIRPGIGGRGGSVDSGTTRGGFGSTGRSSSHSFGG